MKMHNNQLSQHLLQQQESNCYKLGQFVFKLGITRQQIQQIVPYDMKYSTMFSKIARHNDKQFKQISILLPYCSQWNQAYLQLSQDQNYITSQNILKLLKLVSLPSLLILTIKDVKLESVQFMTQLNLKHLTILDISGNFVKNARVLRNIIIENVTSLSIDSSHNMKLLSQLHAPKLNFFGHYDKCLPTLGLIDYGWVAKLESQILNRVIVPSQNRNRIVCKNQKTVLKNKTAKQGLLIFE